MGTSSPRPSDVAPLGAARSALCLAVALLAVVLIGTSTARAATALTWTRSATSGPTVTGPLALSCVSSALCVAVDAEGKALVSESPGSAASWTAVAIPAGNQLTGVSCASASECVAVNSEGEVFESGAPGTATSWKSVADEAGYDLTSVSCGSTALCVAVASDGHAFASTDPGASGSWGAGVDIDGTNALTSVSCASGSQCVAVDALGDALASTKPASGAWSTQPITPGDSPLLAVSCEASGACAAIDEAGYALISTNPTAAASDPDSSGPEWSATDLNAPSELSALSCAPGLCATADTAGESLASEDLGARPAQWSASAIGSSAGSRLDAISCVPTTSCVAVASPSSGAGVLEAFTTSLPAPPPVESPPPPKEETPSVSLVTPNPAISGTPAAGQTLSCEPGLPAGASATVTYQWLANTSPIAGATNPKYKIRSKDEGDHLQCEVTATNAAGSVQKSSSALAVPLAQALVSVGETTVAKASAGKGKVSFTVDCSTKAVGSCKIEATLTLYERLRGTKVLGVSASKPAHAKDAARTKGLERAKAMTQDKESKTTKVEAERKAEAKESVTEVTVGSLKFEVKPGHTRTVNLRLNASGGKLARERKRLPTTLTVSGTVVGVLSGTLRTQTVHLQSAAKATKTKTKTKTKATKKSKAKAGRRR